MISQKKAEMTPLQNAVETGRCSARRLRTMFLVIVCPRQLTWVLAGYFLSKKRSADQIESSCAKSSKKEIRILLTDDHPVVRERPMTILGRGRFGMDGD
jgi:hypothetical protein